MAAHTSGSGVRGGAAFRTQFSACPAACMRSRLVTKKGRARSELGFAQHHELGARAIVVGDVQRVHRLDHAAEALDALACATRKRRHAADRVGEQRDDEIALAVLDAPKQERMRDASWTRRAAGEHAA